MLPVMCSCRFIAHVIVEWNPVNALSRSLTIVWCRLWTLNTISQMFRSRSCTVEIHCFRVKSLMPVLAWTLTHRLKSKYNISQAPNGPFDSIHTPYAVVACVIRWRASYRYVWKYGCQPRNETSGSLSRTSIKIYNIEPELTCFVIVEFLSYT